MSDQQPKPKDKWAKGELYEPYVGRWSKIVAREFVPWVGVQGGDWLDVGCGTGALSVTILESASPNSVRGVDPSEGFLDYARHRVQDKRAEFRVGDARAIPFEDAAFDAVISGLMLNFVPEPEQAVSEMARVARQGATVAAYVWDYADKMEFMRYFWNAAVDLDPEARKLDENPRFPICNPQALTAAWEEAGLTNVETGAIDAPTHFRDFNDYWEPFLGGQGPAPGYVMSLSEEARSNLCDLLRSRLPTESDNSIRLIARAWAVKGIKPATES